MPIEMRHREHDELRRWVLLLMEIQRLKLLLKATQQNDNTIGLRATK